MLVHSIPDVCNHIIQERVIGKAGAGLNLQGELAALAFDLLHKVTGFTDGGDQIGDHFTGGLTDQTGAAIDDCQGIVVAGGDTGNGAVFVVLNSDLRVDAQDQDAALRQGLATLVGCGTLAAGGEAQGQCQHTADHRNQFIHSLMFSLYFEVVFDF